jgi:hypothetical protein
VKVFLIINNFELANNIIINGGIRMIALKITVISLLLALLNIFIIHIVKVKFPKYYFSLGQMVITEKEDISAKGLITRFLPPVVFGIIIGFISKNDGLQIAILFGFFSSFLVIWPVLLSGDELLSWEARKKIKTLYVIYAFYIMSYLVLSVLGYYAGRSFDNINVASLFSTVVNNYPNWPIIYQDIFSGCISTAIIGISGAMLAYIFGKLLKALNKKIIEDRRKTEEQKCD